MDVYEKITSLAKRRGFLYPSYEIYGGEAGFYDYGPLGILLKNRMEEVWREYYILKEKCYEIATPVITPYALLKASGHVDEFIDEIGTCTKCGLSVKVEELKDDRCPVCGGAVEKGSLNLMFETYIGAKKKEKAFLRPETAQGIFVNFPVLYEFFRKKMPFGVIQVGKGFRNEVSPRQGIIRLREFSMAEAELFFEPDNKTHPRFHEVKDETMHLVSDELDSEMTAGEALQKGIIGNEALAYYMVITKKFLERVGIDTAKLRFRQHKRDEMAHYANDCWDAELYSDRFGWVECVGIADRSAYDLTAHMTATGTDMRAFRKYDEPRKIKRTAILPKMDALGKTFRGKAKKIADELRKCKISGDTDTVTLNMDGETIELDATFFNVEEVEETLAGEKFVPHVIEPSYGIDRIFYFVLEHNYKEVEKENETYVLITLPPSLAPIKAGVFPLVNKDGLPDSAREIERELRDGGIMAIYDESGSIGRRYARMDEIGTPFCITVDYQTKDDDTVTVRFRDTTEQVRIERGKITEWIKKEMEK